VRSRLSSRSRRCALGGSLRKRLGGASYLLFPSLGRRVIAVAGVSSRKATVYNAHVSRRPNFSFQRTRSRVLLGSERGTLRVRPVPLNDGPLGG
jgi:hypothetical protein